MDIFETLPSEICLMIYKRLRSRCYMWQLAQASPVMLQEYTKSGAHLAQCTLDPDFDKSMRQDALGIVLYPSWDKDLPETSNELTCRHLRLWAAQGLPDPLEAGRDDRDYDVIAMLDTLHHRMLKFVEDYVAKATAAYPPREFLCLFDPSSGRQLMFKDRVIGDGFDASCLTPSERRRFLKAFLRYELICRVLHPRYGQFVAGWDPKPLFQYQGQRFKPSESEAIQCVHAYLESLYGAMFAQCRDDSWLPESHSKHPLLFPDSFYPSADNYAYDMGLAPVGSRLAMQLAFYGFDPAEELIRWATSGPDGRCGLSKWFRDNISEPTGNPVHLVGDDGLYLGEDESDSASEQESHDGRDGEVQPEGDMDSEDEMDSEAKGQHSGLFMDAAYRQGPGVYRVLYPRLLEGNYEDVQLGIYRQRAWALFDDGRLYPESGILPHLPTVDQLTCEGDKVYEDVEWRACPRDTMASRRSQRWHDTREV